MKLLNEYLSTKVKLSNIIATDNTIKTIMADAVSRLGFDADFNYIDVSKCTTLSGLFDSFYKDTFKHFNGDISKWNISNVTNLCSTFRSCKDFNCDLSDWNTENVTNMDHTFCDCLSLNQPLNNWKVDKVTDMSGMFCCANNFNKPLDKWNVKNVEDISYMFNDAFKFNQDISMWDLSKVKHKTSAFYGCPIKEEFKPKLLY